MGSHTRFVTLSVVSIEFTSTMKTHQLGTTGDSILTVKKCSGEYIVTIKVKDTDLKYIELPPKRLVDFRHI